MSVMERGAQTYSVDGVLHPIHTVMAMDPNKILYTICAKCKRSLLENTIVGSTHPLPPLSCCFYKCNSLEIETPGYKHLFRLLLSITMEDKVRVIIYFDRAACVLNSYLPMNSLTFAKSILQLVITEIKHSFFPSIFFFSPLSSTIILFVASSTNVSFGGTS